MTVRKALIAGITGQDGAYLASYLLGLGYHVVGTSRDSSSCNISRLERLSIHRDVELISLAPKDFRSVQQDLTELNGDGNRDRGRYGEDEPKPDLEDKPDSETQKEE